ncbi:MAG: hypothetical protein WEB53_01375 [Akkermansiaceae bacterium]
MPGPEEITGRLEQAGITYCIVGGLASIAYGRPRLTLDADLVVAINPSQVASLIEAFPAADFYLPPAEILQAELQRDSRGHFNIIDQHSALRADCYLPGRSELAGWELAHRQRLPLGSTEAWFAPPESVIIHKLIFHREGGSEKHLEDIRGILIGTKVDQRIIGDWIDRLGLQESWTAATNLQQRWKS